MDMNGQLNDPAALPPGKEFLVPWDRSLGGLQSRSGRGGEEKNSQTPPEIEPWNPDRPARSPALYRLSYHGSQQQWTQRFMAAKLTRLTHKIAIQLHLVAESCTICSSCSRRPVRKLLDTPSYAASSTHYIPSVMQSVWACSWQNWEILYSEVAVLDVACMVKWLHPWC
jgi:hypothetical protein